jgi:hypothetical protein
MTASDPIEVQAWTVRDAKVVPLGIYASRRSALADLGHG